MPLDLGNTFPPANEVFELLANGSIDTSLQTLKEKLQLAESLEDYILLYEYMIDYIPRSPRRTKFLRVVRQKLYKLQHKKSIEGVKKISIGGEEYFFEIYTHIDHMRRCCQSLLEHLEGSKKM